MPARVLPPFLEHAEYVLQASNGESCARRLLRLRLASFLAWSPRVLERWLFMLETRSSGTLGFHLV